MSNEIYRRFGTVQADNFIDADGVAVGGVSDHGSLSGLADDDHTQYALANGSRGSFAATSHTHAPSAITQAGAVSGDVLAWNGAAWAPATPAAGVTDHGNLTGLSDDDHSIYGLLAGRSGGQTLVGGTGSGENLTLQSTAHATKGRVLSHPITVTQQATSDKIMVLQAASGGAAAYLECLHFNTARQIALLHTGVVEAGAFQASGSGLNINIPNGGDMKLRDGASNTMAQFSHAAGGFVANSGTKRFEWDSNGIGFFAATPVAKQSITGSRGGNAALADLLTKLALAGLITDSTSA